MYRDHQVWTSRAAPIDTAFLIKTNRQNLRAAFPLVQNCGPDKAEWDCGEYPVTEHSLRSSHGSQTFLIRQVTASHSSRYDIYLLTRACICYPGSTHNLNLLHHSIFLLVKQSRQVFCLRRYWAFFTMCLGTESFST